MKSNKILMFFLLICFLFISTCKKVEKEMLVSTGEASEISMTSAKVSGLILDLGKGATNHGHCYSTTKNPTIANMKKELGSPSNVGSFKSSLEGLTRGTVYYVRAFISRGSDVVYGGEINFTTISDSPPILTTTSITEITNNTAVSGGDITSEGGTSIIARGVCWNTNANPTIDNNKSVDGVGMGVFTSSIGGLVSNSIYYVRAYATNGGFTSYGDQKSFTSLASLTTTEVSTNFTSNSALSGGTIELGGGGNITARGVCWSTNINPTITNSKTIEGTGTGTFASSITGLNPSTTYHIRAYATNGGGTNYGNEVSITTDPATITDINSTVYNLVRIGTQLWMKENLITNTLNDGSIIPQVKDQLQWSGLTTPGFCVYNDQWELIHTYGVLYNWYAVNTGKLCPSGWHVPTYFDQMILREYLGGIPIAGGKLKEIGTTHWTSPNTGATNETGFTALPGGARASDGTFTGLGLVGYWWTTTSHVSMGNQAYCFVLSNETSMLNDPGVYKWNGLSVRCIKD